MPSNSEMYDRGALDAEQDDLNPFYYQHYYYYRRGYDDVRRQLRRGDGGSFARPVLIAIACVTAVMLAAGLLLFSGLGTPAAAPAAPATPAVGAAARPTTPPARPTRAPTATPKPTPIPTLGIGARARVANLNGAPLRAREAPGLSRVVARIPEGSEVTLREGPVEADGYKWWRVEAAAASGWVAERSPEGVVFLELIP